MRRKLIALLLFLTLVVGGLQPLIDLSSTTAVAAQTLYVFDLKSFINSLPSEGTVRYDYLKLATALQGLVNRDTPRLYYKFNGYAHDQDSYWLNKLSEDGEFLSSYTKTEIKDFWELLDMFRSYTKGLVLWDSAVPSTSNVASTVAGADSLLPVRFDTSVGSLYNALMLHGYTDSDVKVNLFNKFTGSGTIQGTSVASTGSAKNDAYIWAKTLYLDTGKTHATKMTYSVDSWVLSASTTNTGTSSYRQSAGMISVKYPKVMTLGSSAEIEVTVQNTGLDTWGSGSMYRLGTLSGDFTWKDSVNPSYPGGRAFLSQDVSPLGVYTFKFTITAPNTVGMHTFGAQMVQDGVKWFGTKLYRDIMVVDGNTTAVDLNADGVVTEDTYTSTHNSQYTAASIPNMMKPGESYSISITVKNIGTNTWTNAASYRLGKQEGDFAWTNGSGRAFLTSDVAKNGTHTFNITVTAPAKAGNYRIKARMVQDGVRWFGPMLEYGVAVVDDTSYTPTLETVGTVHTVTGGSSTTAGYSDMMNTMLPNADYFIAEKAFFFDLSPDGAIAPIDDRSQPVGTDLATLRKLLSSQQTKAAGKVFTVSGFVPWWCKYNTFSDSSSTMEPVISEWTMVDIISEYLGQVDADAYGYTGLSNASVFSKVPLNAELKQNNKGVNDNLSYDANTEYIMFYMGDYDAASWTSSMLPTMWDDPERGTLPLAWPICADLSQRVPHVFNYLYETATANDFFVSGDNGTGYLNPMKLSSSELTAWTNHNIASNQRFDIDITGFLIAGNSGTITTAVQSAYNKISPYGVVYQGSVAGGGLYGNTPYVNYYDIGNGITSAGAASVAATINGQLAQSKQFHVFRSILTKPSVINDIVDALKANYPGTNFKVVSPYTFMGLFEASKGGTVQPSTRNAEIMEINAPAKMEAGSTATISVLAQNLGAEVWMESTQHRLGNKDDSASPFLFNGPNTNRIFIPSSASVYTGEVHTFTASITAPTKTGTYTLTLGMVRDGVAWFGNTKSVTITVVEPAPKPQFELVTGSTLTMSDSLLKGVRLGTAASDVKAQFKCDVTVKDASGAALAGSATVGTGCTVHQVDGTGVATIVVIGDINGDGTTSAADLVAIKTHLTGRTTLTDVFYEAGDYNSDTLLSTDDYLSLKVLIKNGA